MIFSKTDAFISTRSATPRNPFFKPLIFSSSLFRSVRLLFFFFFVAR